MSNNLVIVESPAKAKTIEKYLGKDYKVSSCYGHIRDLAKDDKSIDKENGFIPTYVPSPEKKKVIKELKSLRSKSKKVFSVFWHKNPLKSSGTSPIPVTCSTLSLCFKHF